MRPTFSRKTETRIIAGLFAVGVALFGCNVVMAGTATVRNMQANEITEVVCGADSLWVENDDQGLVIMVGYDRDGDGVRDGVAEFTYTPSTQVSYRPDEEC